MAEGLEAKKKEAAGALQHSLNCAGDPMWDSKVERTVEAIIDAAREQLYHDLATRNPRLQQALRDAGLIA